MPINSQIVEVHSSSDAEGMADFFKTIWSDGDEVVPFDLILAATHVGGYAAVAKQDNLIIGASFGFRGEFLGNSVLHSHVTAASVPGLGFELKKHQFEWAKKQKISGITWTFDPLVRRNCVFNFEKLGAVAVQYRQNFYGKMRDSINSGDESDRFFMFLPTASQQVQPQVSSHQTALKNISGEPELAAYDKSKAFWVELPEDIEKIRKSDLSLAKQWRSLLREAVQPALDQGGVVRAMKPDRTAFLVEPPEST
jgi:predicted GNAT superfamily acetyltransferase